MHPTVALYERNWWATRRLLNWCRWQPAATAEPDAADVYGSIQKTFAHILRADSGYHRRLTGEPITEIDVDSPPGLDELLEAADATEARWRELLASGLQPDQERAHEFEDGRWSLPNWVILAQSVHHGDDHRTQIGTLLYRFGVLVPELDGWFFGFEPQAGRPAPAWADGLLARFFEHHFWATRKLLELCARQPAEKLEAGAPGTYGTVLAGLNHLVSADRGYLSRLQAEGRPAPLEDEAPDRLLELWGGLEQSWRGYLSSRGEYERPVECSDGWYPAWILVLQALHHGNDHRTQVGTALLRSEVEIPDLDLWAFSEALGLARAVPA